MGASTTPLASQYSEEVEMKIAILAWGSLISEREKLTFGTDEVPEGNLALATDWVPEGGPKLPIEFSRVSRSRDGALTLVIDQEHRGKENPTSFAESRYQELTEARTNLAKREGITDLRNLEWIGYVICRSNKKTLFRFWERKLCHSRDASIADKICGWAERENKENFDAVIWSDFPSNFDNEGKSHKTWYVDKNRTKSWKVDVANMKFTPENAQMYLHCLNDKGAKTARKYIRNTPAKVETPLRERMRNDPWLNAETTEMQKKVRQFALGVIDENKNSLHNSSCSIRISYWTLYGMYCLLFLVGVVTAVFAIIKGFTARSATDTYSSLIFAGLSAGSFFALFITRPLESLERNSIFSSWLITIINTYWTKYGYFNDPSTVYEDLKKATDDVTKELSQLADKRAS